MSAVGSIAGGLNALGARRFGLSFVALALILAIVFWLRPNVASYNGLRLLLNLSPVLVFTALAQMFVMTAGDIDLGIGALSADGLHRRRAAAGPAGAGGACWRRRRSYALMGRSLAAAAVDRGHLGASFVWLGLA
jgi:hypothetical protein